MCNCNKSYSPLQNLVNATGDVIKGFVDNKFDPYVTSDIKQKRLNICKDCDKLTSFLGKDQCSICYCFIEPKTSLINQSCPHPDGPKW